MQNSKFVLIRIILNITLLLWAKAFGTCTLFILLMLITSTNNALDYFPQIRVLGLCQNQDLFSSFFECLHISPADELNALAVEDYNSCLAQLESHGHNCHAANDEE